MYAGWLIANNCYAVIDGEEILPINGKRFFQTIKELKEWLAPLSLTVAKNKQITKLKES